MDTLAKHDWAFLFNSLPDLVDPHIPIDNKRLTVWNGTTKIITDKITQVWVSAPQSYFC